MPSNTSCKDLKRKLCTLRDGRKLAYIVQAPTERNDSTTSPLIFMLPGMCCTADDVIFRSPPKNYMWVCVDRPGYGDSSTPVDCHRYSYQQFATDMKDLADHMKVTEFFVAGHSSGGPCALACAAHLGDDRVKGVAAIASDAEYVADGAPSEGALEKCFLRCFLPCCYSGLSFGGTCGPTSKRLSGHKVDYRLEHEPYDFRLESITQPTLLAFGANDKWARPHSEFITKQIKGSDTMVIPAANHGTILKKAHMDAIINRLLSMAKTEG